MLKVFNLDKNAENSWNYDNSYKNSVISVNNPNIDHTVYFRKDCTPVFDKNIEFETSLSKVIETGDSEFEIIPVKTEERDEYIVFVSCNVESQNKNKIHVFRYNEVDILFKHDYQKDGRHYFNFVLKFLHPWSFLALGKSLERADVVTWLGLEKDVSLSKLREKLYKKYKIRKHKVVRKNVKNDETQRNCHLGQRIFEQNQIKFSLKNKNRYLPQLDEICDLLDQNGIDCDYLYFNYYFILNGKSYYYSEYSMQLIMSRYELKYRLLKLSA